MLTTRCRVCAYRHRFLGFIKIACGKKGKANFCGRKMKKEYSKVLGKIFGNIGIYFLVFVMAAMVIMVFVNAVARYVFNTSFPQTEELARYGFVWVSFLGAIMAFLTGGHVGVDLLISRVRGKGKLIVRILGEVMIWIIIYILAKGGWAFFIQTYLNPSQGTGLPFGIISVTPLVLVVFLAGSEIKRMIEYIEEFNADRKARKGEVI